MTQEIQTESNSKPLLTIAIPTYNRARYLRELLSVLFDQLVYESRVELIISDNASPDETPAVVEEFQKRGLAIRYIRNKTNIGPDSNFLQCFEQARGNYVWIFGDDDIIVPGGVAAILPYLDRQEYDLVYLENYPIRDSIKPRALNRNILATNIVDAKIFASRIHIFFTFISANIVNKDRVLKQGPIPFASLVGTNLVQLGWTYAALNGFVCGLHIQEKLLGARMDNTGGYRLMEVFGSTLIRVTREWLHADDLRKVIINGTVQRFWPGILLAYRRSNHNFEQEASPREILTTAFKDNLRYWAFVYPILVLPFSIAAWWLLVVRVLNRIDKALGFVMLRLG
jgi:abequosyltransferase